MNANLYDREKQLKEKMDLLKINRDLLLAIKFRLNTTVQVQNLKLKIQNNSKDRILLDSFFEILLSSNSLLSARSTLPDQSDDNFIITTYAAFFPLNIQSSA